MTMSDEAQEGFRVLKTRVKVSIGFSVEGDDGHGHSHWEKSGVAIETESGPGYPEQEQMAALLHYQMMDAVDACDQQLAEIAQRTNELMEVQRERFGGA